MTRSLARFVLAFAVVSVSVVGAPAPASARITETLPWTFAQVFRTTVRLVRVDLGCAITERDEEAGYLTFDYESSGRVHHGSIEIVPGEPGDGVRIIVQLPTLPTYVERMVMNRLERKLRDEVGPPPARTPPAVPAPPPPPEDAPDDDVADAPTRDGSAGIPPGPYW